MQQSAGNNLAPHAAAPAHRLVGTRGEHLVHPSARMGWSAGLQRHHISAGLQRESVAEQWSQFHSPEHDVPARQQRIERPGVELGSNGFQCLNGEHRHCGVHVGGLAEEPVANNPLAGNQLSVVGVGSWNVRGAFARTAKVGVRRRHQKVQHFDVVPVISHASTLAPVRVERRGIVPRCKACFTLPMSKASFTSRRVPAQHYVLAVILGAILTITVAVVVGATNPDDFWPAAGIGALCSGYPAMSLGVRVFVSNNTVTRDPNGEQSVELQWMRQAGAGAFLDVLVATIVASLVLAIGRFQVDALPLLLGLVGLSTLDAGLRYVAIRHRALK